MHASGMRCTHRKENLVQISSPFQQVANEKRDKSETNQKQINENKIMVRLDPCIPLV